MMNIFLLESYIRKINKSDVYGYALKQGIELMDEEVDFLYSLIKSDYKTFIYGNSREVLNRVQSNVRKEVYERILYLYDKYRYLL